MVPAAVTVRRWWSRAGRSRRVYYSLGLLMVSGLWLCVAMSCGREVASDYGEAVVDGVSGDHLPSGVIRVGGGFRSPKGSGWPPSVAIVDTGIDTSNPDLNVVGGINCATSDSDDWNDTHGHGTSLAGVVGARRNGEGVIGVAPGADLYSVRVFADEIVVTEKTVLCGLQWVYDNADMIDVALVAFNRPDGLLADESRCDSDRMRAAICRLVEAGVTVVAAAGNQKTDAFGFSPAKLGEVITVGALVDFDGIPGGMGSPTCGPGEDDRIADFSNTGSVVDLFAPGVCIETTKLAGLEETVDPSGTSLAAAHVAGAAAIYKACHGDAMPDEVRAALLSSAETIHVDGIELPVVTVAPFCNP